MEKLRRRKRRIKSIRKRVSGNSERPRMRIHKSNMNIYVQIIDDIEGKTLCGTCAKKVALADKKTARTCKNIKFAAAVGEEIAKIATEKGIKKVVFDRAGYKYHGAVKALADAARKSGLEF